jgi:hypothetical protein
MLPTELGMLFRSKGKRWGYNIALTEPVRERLPPRAGSVCWWGECWRGRGHCCSLCPRCQSHSQARQAPQTSTAHCNTTQPHSFSHSHTFSNILEQWQLTETPYTCTYVNCTMFFLLCLSHKLTMAAHWYTRHMYLCKLFFLLCLSHSHPLSHTHKVYYSN